MNHQKVVTGSSDLGMCETRSGSQRLTLRIVGHGNDRKLYEHIIRNEHIPDVTLEGRQNPVPYYKEASIFLMTSKSESWD